MLNTKGVQFAARWLGEEHTRCIIRMAEKQERIENHWTRHANQLHQQIVDLLLEQLWVHGKIRVKDLDLDHLLAEFLVDHFFAVAGAAAESTQLETNIIAPELELAKKPTIPRSMHELREMWDRYRKTGRLPKGLRDQAEELKKQYLRKTQQVWKRHMGDFMNGDITTQEDVLRKVRRATDTVASRAKTIIRTETTNYYNDTRREIYDQADAVWGYLFLAIRDQATTKWCTDEVRNGKRGRHGLVYKKGWKVTGKETPSCHWNCRSEMVPLMVNNNRHRRLIENEDLWRLNNTCHPLPPGWS